MKQQYGRGDYRPLSHNRTGNRTQEPSYGHGIRLGVRVFLLVILQVSVIGRIGFFGAVPDILLSYVVTLALTGKSMHRWRIAAVSGLAAGFLADVLGGVGLGVLTLFYFLVGACLPHLLRRGFRGIHEELLFFLTFLAPVTLLRTGVTLLYTLLAMPSGFSFGDFLLGTAFPEFFGTLLFALPVFFLFRGRD